MVEGQGSARHWLERHAARILGRRAKFGRRTIFAGFADHKKKYQQHDKSGSDSYLYHFHRMPPTKLDAYPSGLIIDNTVDRQVAHRMVRALLRSETKAKVLNCDRGRIQQARDRDYGFNPCSAETGSVRWRDAKCMRR